MTTALRMKTDMATDAGLGSVLKILREFQKIDPEFPIQYALCLIEIARDEGLSVTTLATRTGLTLSTASRVIGALSKHRQSGTPYGLIKVNVSATERRRKELFLTARGRAVISGLAEVV